MFQPGDRVRWESQGDDGFPIVRYGFVRGTNGDATRVVVMLDDDLKSDMVVSEHQLDAVTIANLELRLRGTDLITDPALRPGLVNLWAAEADQAGLQIRDLVPIDDHGGAIVLDVGCTLAMLRAAGKRWELRADCDSTIDDAIRIHLSPHNKT